MQMYVAGAWTDGQSTMDVRNPFDGSVVDTVPRGTADDVDRALESATRGARAMAALTGYERYQILHRAADLIVANHERLSASLTREQGKILAEARIEVERASEIFYLSAEEAKRLDGEVVPLDGGPV